MTRFVPVCAAIGLVITAGAAQAEGMLPNGAVITFDKVRINENGMTPAVEPSEPDALRRYLNLAHCTCSQANAGAETTINYQVSLSADTNTNRPGEIWVGTQCNDDVVRPTMCRGLNTIPDIDQMAVRPENIEVSLYDVINGPNNTMPCSQRAGDAFIWILVDSNADNTYDYDVNQSIGKTASVTGIDTEPPPLPTEFTASSAESAVLLEWTPPMSRATDVFHYQALCAGPDGLPAIATTIEPEYQTVRTLCGLEQDLPLTETVIDTGDPGSTVQLPPGLVQLDPAYLCGSTDDATARSLLIEGLENNVPYTVVLVAVDQYGNATGTFFSQTITPQPATDFWEDLHDRGSNVEGGFCLIAETFGDDHPLTRSLRAFRDDTLARSALGRALIDVYYATLGELGSIVHGSLALRILAGLVLAPLVAVALAWHVLSLPGLLGLVAFVWWLKRRRRRLLWAPVAFATGVRFVAGRVVAPAFAAGMLVPGVAAAQGPTPYWEDESAAELEEDGLVRWHVGIRLGPYTPAIDEQFGMSPGPYEQMFGGSRVLPMLDVDRILWRGFGQVGLGGSIGYMQKTANAWADGSDPNDPMRPRSEGDENTFRLMPLMASAVYRFTWLDDELGIPVVPYARAGLAYYLWWVTSNGSTAEACWDGTRTPDCDSDGAIGASFGVVGSVGLAIRAERVDAAAATSMRQGGIEHAGFYAEWSVGRVDGFRPETKLSVGDSTWFVGADFEF